MPAPHRQPAPAARARLPLRIVLAVVLIAVAGYWQAQRSWRQLAVQVLDYRIAQIGLSRLQLDHLSLAQGPHRLHLHDLRLDWRWQRGRPVPGLLAIASVELDMGSAPASVHDGPPWTVPEHWPLPAWLPATIRLDHLHIRAPCAQGRCPLTGQAMLVRENGQWQLAATLAPAPDLPLRMQLHYRPQAARTQLHARVQAAALIDMQLDSAFDPQAADNGWQGHLQGRLEPPSPAWQAVLAAWGLPLTPPDDLQAAPARIDLHWQAPPAALQALAGDRTRFSGQLQLQLQLPEAIALHGLGRLQGELQAALEVRQGQLQTHALQAALVLQPDWPAAWQQAGFDRPLQLSLQAAGASAADTAVWPMRLALELAGDAQGQLLTDLRIDPKTRTVELAGAQLSAHLPAWQAAADWSLQQVELAVDLHGSLQADRLQLSLQQPAQLRARLNGSPITVDVQTLQLAGSVTDWQNLQLAAGLTAQADALALPGLHARDWHWQADLHGPPQALHMDGRLTGSGLELRQQWQLHPGHIAMDWQLGDLFLLAGNPLPTVWVDWPALLELQRGRLQASGRLHLPLAANQPPAVHAWLTLDAVSGLYDTLTFQGLSGTIALQLTGTQLQLQTTDLQLQRAQHGFAAGPFALAAQYTAALSDPGTGRLTLHRLEGQLFDGRVHVPAQTVDLAAGEQSLPLHLERIDLAELLQQHPGSELSGQGRISGVVPLRLGAAGITVAQGQLQAEPGGWLQYRSAQAARLGSTTPAMKLITDALDDFHYDLLEGQVNYGSDGRLLLGLRLQGRNPAVENGRPIHFNITLEEDLPAMITSLQLSQQISDTIRQRVQQKLQHRQSTRP